MVTNQLQSAPRFRCPNVPMTQKTILNATHRALGAKMVGGIL